jgi:hypothetical protein
LPQWHGPIAMITDEAAGVLQDGLDVVHGVETADSAAIWPPAKRHVPPNGVIPSGHAQCPYG